MRFMMMIKATEETEAGVLPSTEILTEMGRYNEELVKAGVLLAGEGLRDSAKGAKVKLDGKRRTVIDGPFTEAKELIAGFWLIEVGSLDEAVEWAKRCPCPEGRENEIEVRQVFMPEDFGDALTPELREAEERIRFQASGN
ncbi:MAG TPA: YciI family protein [Pseudonocardiaceae bacterium]|nr:YciI family protein [Pseudonocardiaceae bacterium]